MIDNEQIIEKHSKMTLLMEVIKYRNATCLTSDYTDSVRVINIELISLSPSAMCKILQK